ncbi:unnamed protein product [Fraxinus pennsylvanica]|uniref:Myb-like domain-containing protein n=1 Tax=Fraxinus pennsylvanica TaxID=56036 RepID=A0AAD2A990_9LAMI|nr:unnamed protein product [Fraxinus pennsylvanica]
MVSSPLGMRKGAWTKEEDNLLRKCIGKYGEGKWNLVPLRAGLNRCRKSCRMRWLNYLTPNIKRGDFTRDEDDLIIRLHKLLGNRWSLIAGRIPGRTANDVKNHWNTHLQKKLVAQKEDTDKSQKTTKSTILKPRPLAFSKTMACSIESSAFEQNIRRNENSSSPKVIEGSIKWWNNLLDTKENGDQGTTLSNGLSLGFLEGGWEDFCHDKNIWEILEF